MPLNDDIKFKKIICAITDVRHPTIFYDGADLPRRFNIATNRDLIGLGVNIILRRYTRYNRLNNTEVNTVNIFPTTNFDTR